MTHCGIILGKDAPTLRRRNFVRSRNDSDRRCCVHAAWTQQRSDDLSARQLYNLEQVMPRKPATTGGGRHYCRGNALAAVVRRRYRPEAVIPGVDLAAL
jgi:hypothetical protein